MKIAIVGPGAIGCLFGGLLREAGADVMILDRHADRALRLSQQGIRIEDDAGVRTLHVPVTADPAALGSADVILFAVKAFDTAEAARRSIPAIRPDALLVSVQNGLGNAEILAALGGPRPVLVIGTSQGSTSMGTGHVRHAGQGLTRVAPFSGGPAAADGAAALVAQLKASGIDASVCPHAPALLWSKLVANTAINPVSALAGIPNGAILERPECRVEAFAAARETWSVALARGLTLLFDDPVSEVERVCRATRENVSSMLQDIRRGSRTEIDAINGAVVREGKSAGVPTPVNASLLQRVLALAVKETALQ